MAPFLRRMSLLSAHSGRGGCSDPCASRHRRGRAGCSPARQAPELDARAVNFESVAVDDAGAADDRPGRGGRCREQRR